MSEEHSVVVQFGCFQGLGSKYPIIQDRLGKVTLTLYSMKQGSMFEKKSIDLTVMKV